MSRQELFLGIAAYHGNNIVVIASSPEQRLHLQNDMQSRRSRIQSRISMVTPDHEAERACSLETQLLHAQILLRTAELSNAAADLGAGVVAVQGVLADALGWELIGSRVYVGIEPDADDEKVFTENEGRVADSGHQVVLLKVELNHQVLALIGFCSQAEGISSAQHHILVKVADQLTALAFRKDQRTGIPYHVFDLLYQGQLSGMAEAAQSLTHELSQPLAAIAAYAGALHRSLSVASSVDSDVNYLSERLVGQVERAGAILQSTKNYLLQLCAATTSVEVEASLLQIVKIAKQSQYTESVKLNVDIGSGLPLVQASEAQLAQVVLCLLDNALTTAGTAGELVTLRAEQVDSEVWISITGKCEKRIKSTDHSGFSPFYSYTDSHQRGLAICRSLAEAQGGRLWVKYWGSEAVFTVSLPVIQ